MTEIEITTDKAIERLEYIRDNELWAVDKLSKAAIKMSIAALREQAERNKGCVWCKSDSQVTHNGEHFCFFCSYCGKRLEVEP